MVVSANVGLPDFYICTIIDTNTRITEFHICRILCLARLCIYLRPTGLSSSEDAPFGAPEHIIYWTESSNNPDRIGVSKTGVVFLSGFALFGIGSGVFGVR